MENNYQDPAQRMPQEAQTNQTQVQQQPVQQQPVQQQNYQQPQQNYQQQPNYQQPQQNMQGNNYNQNPQNAFPPIKVGEWIGAMLVVGIPLIGFIMLLVWAFGTGNPNKANWAKARLLLGLIVGVILIIVYALIFLVAGISMNSGAFNF